MYYKQFQKGKTEKKKKEKKEKKKKEKKYYGINENEVLHLIVYQCIAYIGFERCSHQSFNLMFYRNIILTEKSWDDS